MRLLNPWEKSELTAGSIYGKVVPASGACKELGKSDIIGLGKYADWRGENKWTEKQSYSLKLQTIKKIMREAVQVGQQGFLRVDFNGEVFIVIPERVFRGFNE